MTEVYRNMKKFELLNICRERGITGYSNLVKDRVIDLILQNDSPTQASKKRKVNRGGPEKLILAHTYNHGENQNVLGWYMSEKIDGIRAYWDGERLWSRTGKEINAPESFTIDLPGNITLDGELFMKESIKSKASESLFSKVCSTVRKKEPIEKEWNNIRFYVFDTVNKNLDCNERLEIIESLPQNKYVVILKQYIIKSIAQLNKFHDNITSEGGEGVMIKNPDSMYVGKRTKDLLKLKKFYDTEVKIVGYKPGEGKYDGMLGAYYCEMVNGNKITVGSGMNDSERDNPCKIGKFITIKYFELTTKNHVPRFPVFLRKAPRQEFSSGSIPGSK
jgi:DNA ligase 1